MVIRGTEARVSLTVGRAIMAVVAIRVAINHIVVEVKTVPVVKMPASMMVRRGTTFLRKKK